MAKSASPEKMRSMFREMDTRNQNRERAQKFWANYAIENRISPVTGKQLPTSSPNSIEAGAETRQESVNRRLAGYIGGVAAENLRPSEREQN